MARQELAPPAPGLTNLIRCIFIYLSNHPLYINPIVRHSLSNDLVSIDRYRLHDGIEVRDGLTCSIFAYAGAQGGIPTPSSSNVSSLFEPYDMGSNGVDKARFHIVIKFSYKEVSLNRELLDENIIQVPAWSSFGVGQRLLTSNTKKNVKLEINPGIDIIQDYLMITKYVLDDSIHCREFPLEGISSFEMLSQNVKSIRWEEQDAIIFQEGVALTQFNAYISRGWRENLNPLYLSRTNINNTIN